MEHYSRRLRVIQDLNMNEMKGSKKRLGLNTKRPQCISFNTQGNVFLLSQIQKIKRNMNENLSPLISRPILFSLFELNAV